MNFYVEDFIKGRRFRSIVYYNNIPFFIEKENTNSQALQEKIAKFNSKKYIREIGNGVNYTWDEVTDMSNLSKEMPDLRKYRVICS